jgi:microcystin-dependent protein
MVNLPNLPFGSQSLQQINIGNAPDDGTGDPFRSCFQKFNANMAVLSGSAIPRVTSPLNIYVSPSGNDTSSGLNSNNPLKTIAAAVTLAYSFNITNQQIIINLSPGQYTDSVIIGTPPLSYGGQYAHFVFQRTAGQSGQVTWTLNVATSPYCLRVQDNARVELHDIVFATNTLNTNTGGVAFVSALRRGLIYLGNVTFNSIGPTDNTIQTSHITLDESHLNILQGYTVGGTGRCHIQGNNSSIIKVSTRATGLPLQCPCAGASFINFLEVLGRSNCSLSSSSIIYNGQLTGVVLHSDFSSVATVDPAAVPVGMSAAVYDALTVPNNLTFTGNVQTNGSLNTQGPLAAAGNTTISGPLVVSNNATVSGPTTFTAGITVPTVALTDNSQNAASTAFVQGLVNQNIVNALAIATPTLFGLVKIDQTASNPVVYLKTSVDNLLAQKASLSGAAFVGTVTAPTPITGDNSQNVATTAYVNSALAANATFPPGVILPFGGVAANVPSGYLPCDGRSLSAAAYPNLYAAIGTTWGGSGGNFNLPNLADSTLVGSSGSAAVGVTGGSNTTTLSISNLPAHSHAVTDTGHTHTIRDTGHTHNVSDPGHVHGVSDPGHQHTWDSWAVYTSSTSGTVIQGGVPPAVDGPAAWIAPNFLRYPTNAATSGIGVNLGYTGLSVVSGTTGVGINSSGTGILLQNTGSGTPINTIPKHGRVLFIIKT